MSRPALMRLRDRIAAIKAGVMPAPRPAPEKRLTGTLSLRFA